LYSFSVGQGATLSSKKLPGYKALKAAIQGAKRVLISTHSLPDGDGLGAEAALFHYLKSPGRTIRVMNPDPLPRRYQFLDPEKRHILDPSELKQVWKEFDCWLIVDTNDPRRLGTLWPDLSIRAKKILFIDHHADFLGDRALPYPPHAKLIGDVHSSSIGEMLYLWFQQMKLRPISKKMAEGLYVSIMTDTNSFRYARTTPEAHRIAGDMIALGVNPEEVYQNIYSSKELSHLQLLGQLLQNTKVTLGGKIAWLELGLDLRKKHAATSDDTQSFLNLLLLLKDSEVVCLFREEDDHKIRVSIRSKGRVIINTVAMELGGGGHEYAAGLALKAPMPQTVDAVIERLRSLLVKDSK
jgi:bifunctional oligoribonuclease and PAP phosphatase NrnA